MDEPAHSSAQPRSLQRTCVRSEELEGTVEGSGVPAARRREQRQPELLLVATRGASSVVWRTWLCTDVPFGRLRFCCCCCRRCCCWRCRPGSCGSHVSSRCGCFFTFVHFENPSISCCVMVISKRTVSGVRLNIYMNSAVRIESSTTRLQVVCLISFIGFAS